MKNIIIVVFFLVCFSLSAFSIKKDVEKQLILIELYNNQKQFLKSLEEINKLREMLIITKADRLLTTKYEYGERNVDESVYNKIKAQQRYADSESRKKMEFVLKYIEHDLLLSLGDTINARKAIMASISSKYIDKSRHYSTMRVFSHIAKLRDARLAKGKQKVGVYESTIIIARAVLQEELLKLDENNDKDSTPLLVLSLEVANLDFSKEKLEATILELTKEIDRFTGINFQNAIDWSQEPSLVPSKLDKYYVYEALVEKRFPKALVYLGDIYTSKTPIKLDYSKAFYYYQKAYEAGDPLGSYSYAYCLIDGIATNVDKQKGYEVLNSLKNANDENFNRNGYLHLGILVEDGTIGAVDTLKAIRYYMIAAEEGYQKEYRDRAMKEHRRLFDAYYEKEYVTENLIFNNKSVEDLTGDELYEIAIHYEQLKDTTHTKLYLQKGIEKKHGKSFALLGKLYHEGKLIKRSFPLADQYFKEGTVLNDSTCILYYAYYQVKGFVDLPSFEKATELKKKAEALEYHNQALAIEKIIEKEDNHISLRELGVRASRHNIPKALYYLKRAYEQGDLVSATSIGHIYLRNKEDESSLLKAIEWFKKALPDPYAILELEKLQRE